jgi:hypothetical protein
MEVLVSHIRIFARLLGFSAVAAAGVVILCQISGTDIATRSVPPAVAAGPMLALGIVTIVFAAFGHFRVSGTVAETKARFGDGFRLNEGFNVQFYVVVLHEHTHRFRVPANLHGAHDLSPGDKVCFTVRGFRFLQTYLGAYVVSIESID